MDGVGPDVVPTVQDARASGSPSAATRRQPARPACCAGCSASTQKMRQYADGPAFVARRGRPGRHGRLQRDLDGPARRCRSEAEIADPRQLGRAGARPPGDPRLTAARAPAPTRRSRQVRSAVRPGAGARPTGRCSSPAPAARTPSRWPRRSPSRRRGAGVPAGAVTVDHGLQPGSAERAAQVAALGCASSASTRSHVVRGRRSAATAGRRRPPAPPATRALRDAAAARGAGSLLGHTLDDQAETVLLGLGRGSGPRSIAGMASADRARTWRPLLGVRRATTRGRLRRAAACRSGTTRTTTTRPTRGCGCAPRCCRCSRTCCGGGVAAGAGPHRRAAARRPRRPRRAGRAPSSAGSAAATADCSAAGAAPRCRAALRTPGAARAGCAGPAARRPAGGPPGRRRRAAHRAGAGRAGSTYPAARASSGRLAGWYCCPATGTRTDAPRGADRD